jgi:hypothetical protein
MKLFSEPLRISALFPFDSQDQPPQQMLKLHLSVAFFFARGACKMNTWQPQLPIKYVIIVFPVKNILKVKGNNIICLMQNLHPCHHGLFVQGSIEKVLERLDSGLD